MTKDDILVTFRQREGAGVMPGVADDIVRMKTRLGFELDKDLASHLGVDASAVAAWRRRGRVPEKYQIRFNRILDEDAGRDISPNGLDLRDAYIFAVISIVSRQIGAGWITETEAEDFELAWAGYRLARLYSFLRRELPHDASKDELRGRFQDLKRQLGDGDVDAWLEKAVRS